MTNEPSESVAPDLFIGIVTHPKSRFRSDVTSRAFVHGLTSAGRDAGLRTAVRISDDNAFESGGSTIGSREIIWSAWPQAGVEAAWNNYLGGRGPSFLRRIGLFCLRLGQYLKPERSTKGWSLAGRRLLVRLANIELAHINLMRQAVDMDARWALILEDDAGVEDIPESMRIVGLLLAVGDEARQPRYVNMSRSFENAELGIDALMSPIHTPDLLDDRVVLSASRPVTNTVCAVLYRGSFLRDVSVGLASEGLMPLAAIDWKLNSILMRMFQEGVVGPGDCWFIEPAPFVQRSMTEPA